MKKVPIALAALLIAALFLGTQAFDSPSLSQPAWAHHVGWVTEYTPGTSITIQAHDGSYHTFALAAETKLLPMGRAGELALGSRVTILARWDKTTLSWMAFGIVVHPAGSGAGSAPPTATPTPTAVPIPTIPTP
jgi:hypothetical protein